MKSKKSDNQEMTSQVSASQSSKAKGVARMAKSKAGNQGDSSSLSIPAGQENGAETIQSQPEEHPVFPSQEEVQARIAKRAYELYEQRGWQHGYDVVDWCQAAQEVLTPKRVG